MLLRAITIAALAWISWAAPALADTKSDKIRALIRETGTEAAMLDSMTQMTGTIIPMIRQSLKDAPPALVAMVEEEVSAGFRNAIGDFIASTIPLYSDTFSEAEIDDMRTFYGSPTGQKMAAQQGPLLQRSMSAGAVIGRRVAQEAMERAMQRYQATQPPK